MTEKRRAIIIDVDGTLALRGDQRGPFDFTRADQDQVNQPVKMILKALRYYYDAGLAFLIGLTCFQVADGDF